MILIQLIVPIKYKTILVLNLSNKIPPIIFAIKTETARVEPIFALKEI